MSTCKNCGTAFTEEAEHEAFIERLSPAYGGRTLSIPLPRFCPDCRLQRRMAHRSWWFVNTRLCSRSGKRVFSNHTADCPFPVFDNEIWFSDFWDASDHSLELRLDRPFFPQFKQLSDRIPRPARTGMNFENSDYCNNSVGLKDCYLTFGALNSQGCMYIDGATSTRDCVDGTMLRYCELCYDCANCEHCYNVQSSYNSHNCRDSFFLFNCKSCHHCFGCSNLRHREYCIFNQQYSEADYETAVRSFRLELGTSRALLAAKCETFFRKHPVPHAFNTSSENVSGNYINHSAHVHHSFYVSKCEHLRYGYGCTEGVNHSADVVSGTGGELLYETVQCAVGVYRLAFCRACFNGCRDLLYCIWCSACSHCFGCAGLKRKQYCIFNKQYSKEEYESLIPKIVAHMSSTGEWGEFFPLTDSEFPYNHSVAQRFFPLAEEEAHAMRISWSATELVSADHAAAAIVPPESVPDGDEPFVVRCEATGRPFRVTSEELAFYRRAGVPVPRLAFFERMNRRMLYLGGVQLFDRASAKSGKPIRTVVPPGSRWRVWDAEELESELG